MDQYRCRPEELPLKLYRVHYAESQTTRTDEGLKAANTTTFYGDSERERGLFKQAVEDHFTWGYRGRSPFVSLFSYRIRLSGTASSWCAPGSVMLGSHGWRGVGGYEVCWVGSIMGRSAEISAKYRLFANRLHVPFLADTPNTCIPDLDP